MRARQLVLIFIVIPLCLQFPVIARESSTAAISAVSDFHVMSFLMLNYWS